MLRAVLIGVALGVLLGSIVGLLASPMDGDAPLTWDSTTDEWGTVIPKTQDCEPTMLWFQKQSEYTGLITADQFPMHHVYACSDGTLLWKTDREWPPRERH